MSTRRVPLSSPHLVALLTDFGTTDWYVASMKAVILSRAPGTQFIDITHEVPACNIAVGAFILAAVIDRFPKGTIFLSVVDPGVGTKRALLAARVDGRYLIGPDNGLLTPAMRCGQQCHVVRISATRDQGFHVSRTFHGRDILAPTAAALARGVRFETLGVPAHRVHPALLPRVRYRGHQMLGEVLHVDHFGNLITNLAAADIPGWVRRRSAVHIRCAAKAFPMVSSYGAVRSGALAAVIGSLGLVELAVRGGSAAARLRAGRGTPVALRSAA